MASFDEFLTDVPVVRAARVVDERHSTSAFWGMGPAREEPVFYKHGIRLTLYRSLDTNEVVGCRIDR